MPWLVEGDWKVPWLVEGDWKGGGRTRCSLHFGYALFKVN